MLDYYTFYEILKHFLGKNLELTFLNNELKIKIKIQN